MHSSTSSIQPKTTTTTGATEPVLTQREYLIAVRNRLFAVEEQIWLHEFATHNSVAKAPPTKTTTTTTTSNDNKDTASLQPLTEKKYDQLLRARGELLEEYPLTQLYTDLLDAQKNNCELLLLLLLFVVVVVDDDNNNNIALLKRQLIVTMTLLLR